MQNDYLLLICQVKNPPPPPTFFPPVNEVDALVLFDFSILTSTWLILLLYRSFHGADKLVMRAHGMYLFVAASQGSFI